jgi:pilus assembly protein CpaE
VVQNTEPVEPIQPVEPVSLGTEPLSIALIGPDYVNREKVALALAGFLGNDVHEYAAYPPSLEELPKLMEKQNDVIIIDLDSSPRYALELVEHICAAGATTVMVYSSSVDPELLMRCMRAGAREFLTVPFAQSTLGDALIRAAARRPATRPAKQALGKLLVFLGAKGGSGVTTLACNFAVALAQNTGHKTLLIDLDLPLGDAALNLGIVAEYSTINALQASSRLDARFLATLLVKHSSGLSVLAAPGKFPQFQASTEAIDKLLEIAREEFDNVVVDVGSRLDLTDTALYKQATTVYLVTQTGIPELRNSNRLINQFFTNGGPNLEIVINRYESRSLKVAESHITKALTRPAQWKIPNDYAAMQRMQLNATPIALTDSPVSRLIRQMAKSADGETEKEGAVKKKGFSLFG